MTDILLITFVFLVAGVIAVPIASRFALGSVLGYLLAGIVIGPLLSLLNVDVNAVQHVAEFGVVMMLFLVGMELQPKQLWEMKFRLMGLGGGQIIFSATLIALAGHLFGLSWSAAVAIGLLFSLSSTAIVLQTLGEKGLMKCDGGKASFAVLLTQDIAVIPMLVLLPLLASPELVQSSSAITQTHGFSLVAELNSWQTAAVTVVAILLVIFGGSYLTAPIFRFVSIARLRELFTATALMFVVGIGLLMSLVGLSPALGTFLAGVVLANSSYKHELESNLEPVKGLLLGLFFITVGASIDFSLLREQFVNIVALTLGLYIIKIAVLWLMAALFGVKDGDRWLLALGASQAGEFAFVLLSFTLANHVLPSSLTDTLMLVVALSMLVSPAIFIVYERVIAKRYTQQQETTQPSTIPPSDAKVIIAGSGRVGGIVDRMLRSAGFATTVIDFSVERLEALERFRVTTYFGDATRPDMLHAAGIDDAKLLVIAIDDAEQISKIVQYVNQNHSHVHVIARAVDRHHVYDLYAYGCRDIIRETFDSSLRIGRSAFEALGIPREKAEQMKDLFNEYDRNSMVAVADAYRIGVPVHENEAYVRRIIEMRDTLFPEMETKMCQLRKQEPE
ncbi:cation:proton antiporter [Shewanella sp. AS1]|uniref:cation:proton antiporter domain-containing protein n=1 Tax=Shewanella sp. AS1 TaxID=2907626 RepID=UPI001F206D57|nr:cation:proton antiporter [Shewanella sp. AS1]MCE9678728.1 cation:proton antiporter [Shewanella sp. AS1]